MNLANRPGLQGGNPGSGSGNPRPPVTDFMAEMMIVPPQQLQEPASATAQAAFAEVPAASTVAAAAESAAAGNSAAQGAA